ncbi:MAG: PAS domain S-box protein, partial [Methanoregula sp.]|nr:PAS domain S-box protein [Methanoregula sp.]
TMRERMRECAVRLKTEGHAVFEMVHVAKDGRRIPVEIRSHLFEYRGMTLVLGQARDISLRIAAQSAIREREARLQSIIRAAPVGIGLVIDRVIHEVNDRLCEMTGYPADELVGQSARKFYLSKEEFDRVGTEKYRQVARDGMGSIETRWRKKDGSVIDILLSSSPLDPTDLSAGVTFTAMDISGRKNAEAEIRKQDLHYRFIVENSLDIITLQSPENICTYVSPSVTPLLGYIESDLLGKTLLGLVHPDDLDIVKKFLAGIDTGGLVTHTFRLHHKDGHYLLFESTTNVIRDEKTGRIRELLSISRDITPRAHQDIPRGG